MISIKSWTDDHLLDVNEHENELSMIEMKQVCILVVRAVDLLRGSLGILEPYHLYNENAYKKTLWSTGKETQSEQSKLQWFLNYIWRKIRML